MREFTGKEYLQIDIASSYGLDKSSWDERLSWFQNHEDHLESLWRDADKPAMYLAGVEAWRKTKRGEPTGYMINLDATHSGLQIMATLTGDIKAGKLCNIVDDNEKRNDSYTIIFNKMKEIVDLPNITRETIKKAIMTSFYSSVAKPKELFGEDNYKIFCKLMGEMAPYAWELNNFMLAAWNPNATEYNWDLPDGFHVNVPVMTKITEKFTVGERLFSFVHEENMAKKQGRSLCANLVHSVDGYINRELIARCCHKFNKKDFLKQVKNLNTNSEVFSKNTESTPKENKYKNRILFNLLKLGKDTGIYSVRILDMLTKNNFFMVDPALIEFLLHKLSDKAFEIVSIHDCFRCHPNHGNALRTTYREIMQEIADSRLLESILRDICLAPELQINKPCNLAVTGEYLLS